MNLNKWFATHDEEIDARIARAEREQYLELCRLHKEYLAKKKARAKASAAFAKSGKSVNTKKAGV